MLDRILSFIADRLMAIGTEYTAAWTATSTSANLARVTAKVTLPKGLYIIIVKTPVYGNQSDTLYFGLHGFTTGDASSLYASQDIRTFSVNVTSDTETYVETNFSASKSFSYLDRGKLKAIRIK